MSQTEQQHWPTHEAFEITDGRNRYAPCPACGATIMMGLTTRRWKIAVECGFCSHRGPEIDAEDKATGMRSTTRNFDRDAFDAWNAVPREGLVTSALGDGRPRKDPRTGIFYDQTTNLPCDPQPSGQSQ